MAILNDENLEELRHKNKMIEIAEMHKNIMEQHNFELEIKQFERETKRREHEWRMEQHRVMNAERTKHVLRLANMKRKK